MQQATSPSEKNSFLLATVIYLYYFCVSAADRSVAYPFVDERKVRATQSTILPNGKLFARAE